MIINRRDFLVGSTKKVAKVAVYGGMAYGGYQGGKWVGSAFTGDSLERVIDQGAELTEATAAAFTGAADNGLHVAIDDLRDYVGRKEEHVVAIGQYFEDMQFADREFFLELHDVLNNYEKYLEGGGLKERLVKLGDRYQLVKNQILKRSFEFSEDRMKKDLPESVQKTDQRWADWINRLRGIKKTSPSEAYEETIKHYEGRIDILEELVLSYKTEDRLKLLAKGSMDDIRECIDEVQDEVAEKIEDYLSSDKKLIREEREWLKGLQKIIEVDPSGELLADYLIDTNTSYITSIELSDLIGDLGDRARLNLDVLKRVHLNLVDNADNLDRDKIIAIYERNDNREIEELKEKVDRMHDNMEKVADDLEAAGVEFDTTIYPQFRAFTDSVIDVVQAGKSIAHEACGVVGLVAGVGLTYVASTNLDKRSSRKRIVALTDENGDLRREGQAKDARIAGLEDELNTYKGDNIDVPEGDVE